MQKHGKKGKNMKLFDKMIITTHFIERYCQRILKLNDHLKYQEVKDMVIEDMIERMTMIEKECFIKLKKLILDGPKYLAPLVEGTENKSFSILVNDPEKLFQVAFSLTILFTVVFDKQE